MTLIVLKRFQFLSATSATLDKFGSDIGAICHLFHVCQFCQPFSKKALKWPALGNVDQIWHILGKLLRNYCRLLTKTFLSLEQ